MVESLRICPACNTRVLPTAEGMCPACRRHNFNLSATRPEERQVHDALPERPVSSPLFRRLASAGTALAVVSVIVLTFQHHLRYTASLASQAYLGLAPSDFHSYIYQFAIEALLIAGVGVGVYRWTVRTLSQ